MLFCDGTFDFRAAERIRNNPTGFDTKPEERTEYAEGVERRLGASQIFGGDLLGDRRDIVDFDIGGESIESCPVVVDGQLATAALGEVCEERVAGVGKVFSVGKFLRFVGFDDVCGDIEGDAEVGANFFDTGERDSFFDGEFEFVGQDNRSVAAGEEVESIAFELESCDASLAVIVVIADAVCGGTVFDKFVSSALH